MCDDSNTEGGSREAASGKRNAVVIGVGVLLLLIASAGFFSLRTNGTQRTLNNAGSRLDEGNSQAALQLAESVLQHDPDHAVALAIAGQAAEDLGDVSLAGTHYSRMPPPDNRRVYDAWLHYASLRESAGEVDQSIRLLEQLLANEPQDVLVLRRLAGLYAGCQRTERALPYLRQLVQLGEASERELTTLAMNGEDPWDFDRVQVLHDRCPTDRSLTLALAKHLQRRRRLTEARRLLDDILITNADDVEMLSLRSQLADGNADRWLNRLPADTTTAEAWSVRATQAEQYDIREAAEHAGKAVVRDPFSAERNYVLLGLLNRLANESVDPAPPLDEYRAFFGRQFDLLTKLDGLCRMRHVVGTERCLQVVGLLKELGRFTEAAAWCRLERRFNPSKNSDWARQELAAMPRSTVETELDLPFSLSEYPLLSKQRSSAAADNEAGRIRLIDVAAETGLDFSFYNGALAHTVGRRMYEFTGGGVGVLDLDADTWPDLFFAQGTHYPRGHPEAQQSANAGPADQLYRNHQGQRFQAIGALAGITDYDFGQGVGIGDVNNDGFDDIYVANLGPNTLWINQGDGTFLKQTPHPESSVWTMSVAIADIDGDSYPDLYDVNYVGGDDVMTQVCEHGGRPSVCGPTDFSAERDVVLFAEGDGRFTAADRDVFPIPPDGRGMGIVVGDLMHIGTNQILVANDESPNFYFEQGQPGRHFLESGARRGLAVGRRGEPQGSMGIAAGDSNGDGRTDLFLTNFYAESNVLHEQSADGFFPDAIAQRELDRPGQAMLGFGTQFFDANLDGHDDLFVANGHLDDFTDFGTPFRMRPQLFENVVGLTFQEQAADEPGYFSQPVLGRSVVRLDWNRDGRVDLCVTHLDRPAALLQNETKPARKNVRAISVCYTGVRRSRDAVGIVLQVPVAERRRIFPILAGDGYAGSNERAAFLATTSPDLELHAGDERFEFLDDGAWEPGLRLKIIEGRHGMWRLPR